MMEILSLQFQGRLSNEGPNQRRYAEMCRNLEAGSRTVVLDLSQVPDINSEGIGFLVMCLATAQQAGAQLRLAAPTEQVREALAVTRLDPVFTIFDTVESALSARPS
jgi:anti-sigma B factor antagonist